MNGFSVELSPFFSGLPFWKAFQNLSVSSPAPVTIVWPYAVSAEAEQGRDERRGSSRGRARGTCGP